MNAMNAQNASRTSPVSRSRAVLAVTRWIAIAAILAVVCFAAANALAQGSTPPPAAPATAAAAEAPHVTLRELFVQSFDLFTILLVTGSIAGWTIIIKSMIEIRRPNIAPVEPEQIITNLCKQQRWGELRTFVNEDDAMVSKIVKAALDSPGDDMNALRESAELAASEESSKWFRKLEPLNVIGNLGPLLGLAGTVYGMIIAFAALGATGGQANPATLSTGIAKALFHTLLGLLLAVPCLTVFGFYRSLVDRLCTRAIVAASNLVELLPSSPAARGAESNRAAPARPAAAPRPMAPAPRS